MTDFLKPSRKLQDLLEEPAYLASGDNFNGVFALTETQTFQPDLSDALTAITLSRTTNKTAVNGEVVSQTAWTPTNTPVIDSVENAALDDEAKVLLKGGSVLSIKCPEGEARFGDQVANLTVLLYAPVSTTAGGCVHPSKVVPCKGEITGLDADTLTVKFSLPNAEGYRIAGKGKGQLFVTNIKQQARSSAFEVEVV